MCLLHAKDKKAVANSRSGNFYYIMAVLSIFNEILKKSVVFASERDISCSISQNSRSTLIPVLVL